MSGLMRRNATQLALPFNETWPTDPTWLTHAFTYIGQKEVPGSKDNPIIQGFLSWTDAGDHAHDEVPWCAAFVRAMLQRRGPALARSLLNEGVGCDFKRGCVVIFARGSSSWEGHATFGLKEDGENLYCLGGNQSDSVDIATFPKAKVLGYRWF